MASSDPVYVCNVCTCKNDGKPCHSCTHFGYKCRGTCPCCQQHRIEVFDEKPSTSKSARIQIPVSTCDSCNCKMNCWPCDICTHYKYTCKGTCRCCEKYRKLLSTKSVSASPIRNAKVLVNKCSHCDCHSGRIGCKICMRSKFTCAGNCGCCATHRRKLKFTVDEKYVDKVVSNDVISSAQSQAKKLNLIPPEMLNNVNRGNLQQPPAVPQIINYETPPAIPQPIAEEKKEKKRMLCSQCFCDGDVIPCKICIVKETQCSGSCPCCVIKVRQVLLNPSSRKFYQKICPGCFCKLGEGKCDFCSKFKEEKAKAVKTTDQNVPSTSGTSQRKRKSVSKVGVRAKSSVNPADIRAKQVQKRSAPLVENSVESPSKRMRTIPIILPFSGKIKEYCIHCDCVYGTEPCDICGRDYNCLGICRCCSSFNRQLLPINEILPVETSDEIPDVQVMVQSVIESQPDHSKSTSGIHTEDSYSQSNKCVECDCVKYVTQCNNCIISKPPCTFSGDETFCSCCWEKLGIGSLKVFE